MRPIPISAARQIAEAYGYDQVVIIARKVGVRQTAGTTARPTVWTRQTARSPPRLATS